jgi:hypothetical protein
MTTVSAHPFHRRQWPEIVQAWLVVRCSIMTRSTSTCKRALAQAYESVCESGQRANELMAVVHERIGIYIRPQLGEDMGPANKGNLRTWPGLVGGELSGDRRKRRTRSNSQL